MNKSNLVTQLNQITAHFANGVYNALRLVSYSENLPIYQRIENSRKSRSIKQPVTIIRINNNDVRSSHFRYIV